MEFDFVLPYRSVSSPITESDLTPLEPWIDRVQLAHGLSDDDYCKLAAFLKNYPDITLRVFFSRELEDLEFLRFFPELKCLQIDLFELKSLNGLRYLPENLKTLAIGETRSKALSLEILERFLDLEDLFLSGHTKNFASIGRLSKLKQLSLASFTLKDLSFLLPLKQLEKLRLALGGTKDISLLPEIGRLKYLEIWRVRGLSDLSAISKLTNLQFLFLQTLKDVTCLPDLSHLEVLRRVHLETMKGITDLKPISNAPKLEELFVLDCCHLRENNFMCFKAHPSLKKALIAVGSTKANQKIDELLQLEKACRGDFSFEV